VEKIYISIDGTDYDEWDLTSFRQEQNIAVHEEAHSQRGVGNFAEAKVIKEALQVPLHMLECALCVQPDPLSYWPKSFTGHSSLRKIFWFGHILPLIT
jgi:hypothetical protein